MSVVVLFSAVMISVAISSDDLPFDLWWFIPIMVWAIFCDFVGMMKK